MTLAVRPEQVLVRTGRRPAACAAEVVDVSFFGHDATIRVRAGSTGEQVTARTPAGAVPRRRRPGPACRSVGDVVPSPTEARAMTIHDGRPPAPSRSLLAGDPDAPWH